MYTAHSLEAPNSLPPSSYNTVVWRAGCRFLKCSPPLRGPSLCPACTHILLSDGSPSTPNTLLAIFCSKFYFYQKRGDFEAYHTAEEFFLHKPKMSVLLFRQILAVCIKIQDDGKKQWDFSASENTMYLANLEEKNVSKYLTFNVFWNTQKQLCCSRKLGISYLI